MSAWYVIEGDDHEQRRVEADSEDRALDAVAAAFSEQYGEPYGADQIVTLGIFETEDAALEAHPEALE